MNAREAPRVLVACEFSGVVRDAFIAAGCNAVSCDLEPTQVPGPHIQGDALKVLGEAWDLVIAHPPCTYLCVTGNRWFRPEYATRFPTRRQDREDAAAFFMAFANATHIPRRAIENPVGIMSTRYRPPDQVVQPYHFGDRASKLTHLWLFGLPPLLSLGGEVAGRGERVMYASGKTAPRWYADAVKLDPKARATARSRTFPGIAQTMADQWAPLLHRVAA